MSKEVPLVVYSKAGERRVVGKATISEESDGPNCQGFVSAEIEDDELIQSLGQGIRLGDFTIGWLHPAALSTDFRAGVSLNDLLAGELTRADIVFKKPLKEEL
jgi:hypothetical protein